LYDVIYNVKVFKSIYSLLGRFFDGWETKGVENYIGLYVDNKKNDFIVKFTRKEFDTWEK
jgi:hypothetical protein